MKLLAWRVLAWAVIALSVIITAPAQIPAPFTPYQLIDASTGVALPCVGCYVYTYYAGTSNLLATYTDSTLTTPNTNPVRTDSSGYAVNGSTITGIWIGANCYKFVAQNSQAVTLWTQDNICNQVSLLQALLAGANGASYIGFSEVGSTTSTVQTTLRSTYIWDFLYTSPLAACSASKSTGVPLGFVKHWLNVANEDLATIGCNIVSLGGTIQAAAGATINMPQNTTVPLVQQFYDASNFDGTHFSFAFPNGVPNVYGPTQFGMTVTGSGATNKAAFLAAANACPANPNGHLLVTGDPERVCEFQFPQSSFLLNPVAYSTGITLQGVGFYNFGLHSTLTPITASTPSMTAFIMPQGTATSGSEVYELSVIPDSEGGNASFGTIINHIWVDCNGGFYYGNNTSSSGIKFYGAQGSNIDKSVVINCGKRGLVLPNTVSSSGLLSMGDFEAVAITQGPGIELDGVVGLNWTGIANAEYINPNGTYVDADGDPNAGFYCSQCANVHLNMLEDEDDYLGVSLSTSNKVIIDQLPANASGNPPTPKPQLVLIKNNTIGSAVRNMFQYQASPYLYTLFVNDTVNGVQIPGNMSGDYPSASYEQSFPADYHQQVNVISGTTPSGLSFTTFYVDNMGKLQPLTWQSQNSSGPDTPPPTYNLLFPFMPPQNTSVPVALGIAGELGHATSISGNYSSSPIVYRGTYWDGAAIQFPTVTEQLLLGTGTSPTKTYSIGLPSGGNFNVNIPTTSSAFDFVCIDGSDNIVRKTTACR